MDYKGMLPAGADNYADGPDAGAMRLTVIYKPDKSRPIGVAQVKELITGPAAKAYKLDAPCFQKP